jgi:hypothetical protein
MKTPRTLQDIRGITSMPTCPGPASEQKTYTRLTVLARERQRLLSQQESWQRRLRRITSRLAEIDAKSERLRGQAPRAPRAPGAAERRQAPRRRP